MPPYAVTLKTAVADAKAVAKALLEALFFKSQPLFPIPALLPSLGNRLLLSRSLLLLFLLFLLFCFAEEFNIDQPVFRSRESRSRHFVAGTAKSFGRHHLVEFGDQAFKAMSSSIEHTTLAILGRRLSIFRGF